jgi:hypothetical protein
MSDFASELIVWAIIIGIGIYIVYDSGGIKAKRERDELRAENERLRQQQRPQ